MLLSSWVDRLLALLEDAMEEVDVKYAEEAAMRMEWKMIEDQAIMANNEVVGMTTSQAAIRQKTLKELKPKIGKSAQLFQVDNYSLSERQQKQGDRRR